MKKQLFLFCLFGLLTFQTWAQFKYEELTENQKQQVKAIETAYNTATGQQATVTYNEYMLEITLAGENKQFLPLVDIEAITIEENYFLKLHHSGGWEYSGLYKMMGKENTETVKAKLQGFLYNFEPFDEDLSAELCHSVRYLKTSTDDDNFYDFEYKMLRLAGITDIHNADDLELKLKMSELWNKHYKDFECMSATNIYPIGNYLRQLARADGEDAFELVLDNYGFDPNIIDRDGCSALNYLVAQISSPESYAIPAIERFKKYHKILLEYGAKTANELCGCEKC